MESRKLNSKTLILSSNKSNLPNIQNTTTSNKQVPQLNYLNNRTADMFNSKPNSKLSVFNNNNNMTSENFYKNNNHTSSKNNLIMNANKQFESKKSEDSQNNKKTFSYLDMTNKTSKQREEALLKNKSVLVKRFNLLREKIRNLDSEVNPSKMVSKLGITKSVYKQSRAKVQIYSNATNTLNMQKNNILNRADPEEAKFFTEQMSNPSLGNELLAKKFPILENPKYKSKLWKYENKFKINYQCKALDHVLVGFIVNKEADDRKYQNSKNTKYAQVSKLKMRWKTMKWLIDNKKDCLDRLMKFQENLLNTSKKKAKSQNDEGLTKPEFTKLMITNGITNDYDLINKLFWVFDENGDGDLKYSEIAFGVEMFRDSSMEQKLKSFFDLCDVDGSGSISKTEFINLFKKNIINSDERLNMKLAVDKIFNSVQTDENGDITFEQLKIGCATHKDIYDIIDKNLIALKSIDMIIDNDIKNDIMSFNPDANEQLRIKLLDQRVVFIPSRDEKFSKIIDDLIKNKEIAQEAKMLKDELKDNSFNEDEEDQDSYDYTKR